MISFPSRTRRAEAPEREPEESTLLLGPRKLRDLEDSVLRDRMQAISDQLTDASKRYRESKGDRHFRVLLARLTVAKQRIRAELRRRADARDSGAAAEASRTA